MTPTNTDQRKALEEALYVLTQATSFTTKKARDGHAKAISDLQAALPAHAGVSEADTKLELGDTFMRVLRGIHGDMPDAFADSARLAFVHTLRLTNREITSEPKAQAQEVALQVYNAIRLGRDGHAKAISDLQAALPAHAGVSEADDAAHTATIIQRDLYHDIADELAERIAKITGVDIGEHSSDNDPWMRAKYAADEYLAQPKAQAQAGGVDEVWVWHGLLQSGAAQLIGNKHRASVYVVQAVASEICKLLPAPEASEPAQALPQGAHSSKQRTRAARFVPSADGKIIDDDDFLYDAMLKVTGDFGDDETRISFAQWLCDKLNAPEPSDSGLAPTESKSLAAPPTAGERGAVPEGWTLVPVDEYDQLGCCRRLLEIIAVGDSEDPVKDARAELVAHGFWVEEGAKHG
jgi:hypothetical protein